MIFTEIVNRTRDRFARRRRYNRMIAEIESMTQRDLADINGNRADMMRHAWVEVYGR
ncbi:MAG: hypothetical protein AB7I79_05310 [Rhizobiaceae bacterium]